MIRDLKDLQNIVVDVQTKQGSFYEACDIPPRLMGEYDRVISFWVKDKILCFNVVDIEWFTM